MKSRNLFVLALLYLVACGGAVLGAGWLRRSGTKWRVRKALRDKDELNRLRTLVHLRDTRHRETAQAVVDILNSSDEQLRHRAARSLALVDPPAEFAALLAARLKDDESSAVRLSAAVALMEIKTPFVDRAYIEALGDTNEKVVQIACMQLGYRPSNAAAAALFKTLDHSSWQVRLSVCRTLIQLETANERVVSALKELMQSPEAAEHDKMTDEIDAIIEEITAEGTDVSEFWTGESDKMADILRNAQQIAAVR